MTTKNLNAVRNRVLIASNYKEEISSSASNTFVGIGRARDWDDNIVPQPIESSQNLLNVFDTLVGLKRITGSDCSLVIPRNDWSNNKVYSEYTEKLNLFSYEKLSNISGISNSTTGSFEIVGTDTDYTAELVAGDFIVMLGDQNGSPTVTKEIVVISNSESITVNSSFGSNYTDNTLFKLSNTYPKFSNEFYVRNNRDQVFKCLFNNFGASSVVVLEIDLDGQLPENAFIETGDGYKWKYMYTIPSGLKEKFFTKDWMPVIQDPLVKATSQNGRIDIVKLLNGGTGYRAGGNDISANIINVIGDGIGANLTAQVTNGVITGINIFNPGRDYTNAVIQVVDQTKLVNTADAQIEIVIGPQNGHGFDNFYELGATNMMISLDLDATENGTLPTETSIENFDFRKINILRNPLSIENSFLDGVNYRTTSIIAVSNPPAGTNFFLDEIVFQGPSLEEATFSGVVANWRSEANEIWINNIRGNFQEFTPLRGTVQTTAVTAFTLTRPIYKMYTGELLYIENRDPIVRDFDQTEQVKLVFSF